jgi:hypothetical protein
MTMRKYPMSYYAACATWWTYNGTSKPEVLWATAKGSQFAVNKFYGGWTAPPLTDDELRVYSGGWIAGNLEGVEPRQYLFTSLVYAPTVIIHDHCRVVLSRPRGPAVAGGDSR